ncbi:MAG: GDSL-type esterase/lipase family protein [Bryobacteraceae bacterium]
MKAPFPPKTTLAILTFAGLILLPTVAPALKNYQTLDWHNIPDLFDFPLRDRTPTKTPEPLAEEKERLKPTAPTKVEGPKNLLDPSRSLDHFYASLLNTEQGKAGGVTRVLHYGDSPTTADLITADARAMLQKKYGDAGHGFVLIGRPWAWYGHRGIEITSANWKIDPATTPEIKDGLYGLGGVSFRGGPGAMARLTLKDRKHTEVEIAYLAQPGGGTFTVEADTADVALGSTDTDSETKGPAFVKYPLPADTKNITIRVKSGNVRLYGASLTKDTPGIVYNSLGLNGAYVSVLARMFNAQHWTEELRHYDPDLVIVNYGTNESVYPKFLDSAYEKEMKEIVRRLRGALPRASILVMSPMDRGQRESGGHIGTVAVMPRLIALEQQVALETNCAFFNTFEAMGGLGTMGRWYEAEPRLVGADFIHPMPAGAKIVGNLLYDALVTGYNQYKLRHLQQRLSGGSKAESNASNVGPAKAGPTAKPSP